MFHFLRNGWIGQTQFGHVMRESLCLFPVVETLRVGIVSLVTSAFLLDLRLFGVD